MCNSLQHAQAHTNVGDVDDARCALYEKLHCLPLILRQLWQARVRHLIKSSQTHVRMNAAYGLAYCIVQPLAIEPLLA